VTIVYNLQVPFVPQSRRWICRVRLCSDKVVFCNLFHSDESRHVTDGHWHDWDSSNPPIMYMELAGPNQTFERPDQWIHPVEYKSSFDVYVLTCFSSIVVQVKAAEVVKSGYQRRRTPSS